MNMTGLLDAVLVSYSLLNFLLLGSSRLQSCIRFGAWQGIAVGLLPLVMESHRSHWFLILFALAIILLKGVVFPWLLGRAIREARVCREVEPSLGFLASMLLGLVFLGVSIMLSTRLPLPPGTPSLAIPAGFFTMLCGLLILVTRSIAVNQIVGYLTLENGVYVLGLALALEQPMLVETAMLLDVFVAVFVMGVTAFHIQREFDHLDTNRLSRLKD
jgi:hydrogenase-4 component E